jgi:antitoxin component of MazEF toxin-antitoxin module
MPGTVKIIEIGGSLGIILPQELMDRLHLKAADELQLTETRDGIPNLRLLAGEGIRS